MPSVRSRSFLADAAPLLGLAAINVALVLGLGAGLADGEARAIATAEAEQQARQAEVAATALAHGALKYLANPPLLARRAAALAPKNARYAIALATGKGPVVVAASDAARVGTAPDATLARALDGPALPGAFAAGGTRYETYRHLALPPVPGQAPAIAPRVYTVKRGDTLYAIARAAYGDAAMHGRILEANAAALGATGELKAGMVLSLPPKAPAGAAGGRVRALAVSLELPVAPATAAADAARASTLRRSLEAAAGTLALWGAGLLWVGRVGRRRSAAARAAQWTALAERLAPAPGSGAAQAPTGWRWAQARFGPEHRGVMAEWRPTGEGKSALWLAEAQAANGAAVATCALATALWQSRAGALEPPETTVLAILQLVKPHLRPGDGLKTLVARFDAHSGAVVAAAVGLDHVYVLRATGELLPLAVGSLSAGTPEAPCVPATARLQPGDVLVAGTSALVRIAGRGGEPFGPARLEAALRGVAGQGPDAVVEAVAQAAKAFSGQGGRREAQVVAVGRA